MWPCNSCSNCLAPLALPQLAMTMLFYTCNLSHKALRSLPAEMICHIMSFCCGWHSGMSSKFNSCQCSLWLSLAHTCKVFCTIALEHRNPFWLLELTISPHFSTEGRSCTEALEYLHKHASIMDHLPTLWPFIVSSRVQFVHHIDFTPRVEFTCSQIRAVLNAL